MTFENQRRIAKFLLAVTIALLMLLAGWLFSLIPVAHAQVSVEIKIPLKDIEWPQAQTPKSILIDDIRVSERFQDGDFRVVTFDLFSEGKHTTTITLGIPNTGRELTSGKEYTVLVQNYEFGTEKYAHYQFSVGYGNDLQVDEFVSGKDSTKSKPVTPGLSKTVLALQAFKNLDAMGRAEKQAGYLQPLADLATLYYSRSGLRTRVFIPNMKVLGSDMGVSTLVKNTFSQSRVEYSYTSLDITTAVVVSSHGQQTGIKLSVTGREPVIYMSDPSSKTCKFQGPAPWAENMVVQRALCMIVHEARESDFTAKFKSQKHFSDAIRGITDVLRDEMYPPR